MIWRILYHSWTPKEICFFNQGSFLEYYDGEKNNSSLTVAITYNQNQTMAVTEKECFPVLDDQTTFSFNWSFSTSTNVHDVFQHGAGFYVRPRTATYVIMGNPFSEFVTLLLVFLFTGVMLRSFKEAIEFIRRGWE